MTDTPTVNKEKLMTDLQVVIADAEALLRMTADQAGEGAADIRARVQARMDQAKTDLLEVHAAAVAKAKEVGHVTDEFVHENPWKSVAIGAGLGLLLGLLVSRR